MRALRGCWLCLGLCCALQAQYPSSDRRLVGDPLLAESGEEVGFPFNPAALANRPWQPFAITRRVDLLDIHLNLSLFDWLTNLPGLQHRLLTSLDWESYVVPIAENTSFANKKITNLSTLKNEAQASYLARLVNKVVPSVSARIIANPGGFSVNSLLADPEYQSFIDTINQDLAQARINAGKVMSLLVDDMARKADFLSFYSSVDLLGLSWMEEGFGVDLTLGAHAFFRPNLNSNFVADLQAVKAVQVAAVDPNNLPDPATTLAQPAAAVTKVETELRRVAQQTVTDLVNGVDTRLLLVDNVHQLLRQGKASFYLITEASLRVGYGLSVVPRVWQLGAWLNLQGFWGHDNYTVDTSKLALASLLPQLNPFTGPLGFHAGLDLGSNVQIAPWLSWSLLLSDVVGLAQGKEQASASYFGDLYYPFDLDTGLAVSLHLGANVQTRFGVEVLDLLDIFWPRLQRFNQQFHWSDHLRFFASFELVNSILFLFQYYNRNMELGLQFIVEHFRPQIRLGFSPVTLGLEMGLSVLVFSWW